MDFLLIVLFGLVISYLILKHVLNDPELKLARYEDEPFTKPAENTKLDSNYSSVNNSSENKQDIHIVDDERSKERRKRKSD